MVLWYYCHTNLTKITGKCKSKQEPLTLVLYSCQLLQRFWLTIFLLKKSLVKTFCPGSRCSAFARAITSDARDPWFESSHQHLNLLFTILKNLYWKDKNKHKRGWEWPICDTFCLFIIQYLLALVQSLRKSIFWPLGNIKFRNYSTIIAP